MRIKARYAVGNTGSTLHKVDQASGRNKIEWFIFPAYSDRHGRLAATLIVKLQCQRPSILRDPFLMNEIDLRPKPEIRKMMGYPRRVVLCRWCFTDEERDEVRADQERASSEAIRLGRAVER